MRLACALLLLVGVRAAGVAPAETLASAVPAEKKNPIDAVEATYGRVKQRWRDYLSKPKSKAADAPADAAKSAEKRANSKDEPAPEKPKRPWFQKPRQIIRGLLRLMRSVGSTVGSVASSICSASKMGSRCDSPRCARARATIS